MNRIERVKQRLNSYSTFQAVAHILAESNLNAVTHDALVEVSEVVASDLSDQLQIRLQFSAMCSQLTNAFHNYSEYSFFCDDPKTITATINSTFNVLAYTQSQLSSLLKLLSSACYMYQVAEALPKTVADSLDIWLKDAQVIADQVGLANTLLPNLVKSLKTYNSKFKDADYTKMGDGMEKLAAPIVADRGIILNKIRSDPSIKNDYLTYFKLLLRYMQWSEPEIWERLTKSARVLGDAGLNSIMQPTTLQEKVDTSKFKALHSFLEKTTKRKGAQRLAREEGAGLTDAQKIKHKELNDAAKAEFGKALHQVVHESGEGHMHIEQARTKLNAMGVPTWKLPTVKDKALPLHVGTDGTIHLENGTPLNRKIDGGYIEANPKFDPNSAAASGVGRYYSLSNPKGIGGNQGGAHLKTEGFAGKQAAKKETVTNVLIDNVDDYRKKWGKDLAGPDSNNKRFAAMVELIHQTSARTGNDKSAAGTPATATSPAKAPTYGITELRPKFITVKTYGSLKLHYVGKDGITHTEYVKPKDQIAKNAIAVVKSLMVGKKPMQNIWSKQDKSGGVLTRSSLNTYLKKIGGSADLSPHKFRHANGTKLWRDLLADPKNKLKPAGDKPTQKEVNDHHKMITTKVGNLLGHRKTDKEGKEIPSGTNAAKNYISPKEQAAYFRGHNYNPIPKWLELLNRNKEE